MEGDIRCSWDPVANVPLRVLAHRVLPMQSPHRVLRSYQAKLVTDVCRATGDALVEQPTGSGKTMQVVTLVAMHLGGVESVDSGQIRRRLVRQSAVHRRSASRLGRRPVANRRGLARAWRAIVLLHGHALPRRWPAGRAGRDATVSALAGRAHGR